jgi:hypothetical protein
VQPDPLRARAGCGLGAKGAWLRQCPVGP